MKFKTWQDLKDIGDQYTEDPNAIREHKGFFKALKKVIHKHKHDEHMMSWVAYALLMFFSVPQIPQEQIVDVQKFILPQLDVYWNTEDKQFFKDWMAIWDYVLEDEK